MLFDEINASEITGEIARRIPPYVNKIMTTSEGNLAFTKYNDPKKVAKWDWIAQGMGEAAVKASGLYSSREPIMYYNASEAGYPFRKGTTIWEMCAGLVSQVHCYDALPRRRGSFCPRVSTCLKMVCIHLILSWAVLAVTNMVQLFSVPHKMKETQRNV